MPSTGAGPVAVPHFRQAMAQLAAAVSIVTTDGPAGRCGITATAVCAITDTPPTVLVCVNRGSAMNAVFKANGRLCVNVLSGEHLELARHFAGLTQCPMAERFASDDWRTGPGELPVLDGARVNLLGRMARVEEIGTHSLFFVELDAVHVDARPGDALAYFNRAFHRVGSLSPA